jgi:hypothetical protein
MARGGTLAGGGEGTGVAAVAWGEVCGPGIFVVTKGRGGGGTRLLSGVALLAGGGIHGLGAASCTRGPGPANGDFDLF